MIHRLENAVATDHLPFTEDFAEGTVDYYSLNGITLAALTFEHRYPRDAIKMKSGDYLNWSSFVPLFVHSVDAMIFEYFPKELERLHLPPKKLGRSEYQRQINYRLDYFAPFANSLKSQQKPAFVCDPARDELYEAMFWGLLPLQLISGSNLNVNRPIQRFGEADFRRCIVSMGLTNLSLMDEFQGKTIGVLYPPDHWRGIKDYLGDPTNLTRRFSRYTFHLKGPLSRYRSIRKYEPGEDWNLVSRIPITNQLQTE